MQKKQNKTKIYRRNQDAFGDIIRPGRDSTPKHDCFTCSESGEYPLTTPRQRCYGLHITQWKFCPFTQCVAVTEFLVPELYEAMLRRIVTYIAVATFMFPTTHNIRYLIHHL